MKSVRKVKGKGGYHHNAEDNQSRCHSVGPLERKDEHGTHLRRLHTSRTECRLLLRLSTDNCFSLIFPLVTLLLTCWGLESSPGGFQRDKISPANANYMPPPPPLSPSDKNHLGRYANITPTYLPFKGVLQHLAEGRELLYHPAA